MRRECDHCGEPYERPPSLIGKYCSKQCAYAARRKERTQHRRMRRIPSHPLAGKTGLISEARVVLFDAIGWGPHPCHWCGKTVDWQVGARGNNPDALTADHLDRDPLNDALENLVPACGTCNGHRALRVRDEELFVTRANGSRLRAVERTCEGCGIVFLAAVNQVRAGKGRFHSRSCARKSENAGRR